MSSMLEQAIVDAAALREAALKNAEQAIIEKYAPEIKAAVNSLLEEDDSPESTEDSVILEQEESPMSDIGLEELPHAATAGEEMCGCPDEQTDITFSFSLDDFESEIEEPEEEIMSPVMEEPEEELPLFENNEVENDLIEELTNILSEFEDGEETLEEKMEVDMGQAKNGTFETNQGTLKYQQEMELAKMESDKYKEENEVLEKRLEELDEAKQQLEKNLELYETTIYKLNEKLQSTLLSNAKLLYSNRVLSDASLNERQKTKIVEAINKARSVEEAKTLHETLKTTVGSTKSNGPQSLSETVQRKSNLSSMISGKRHETPQADNFTHRMKKLAGIK